jgi:hypothetical protein
MPETGVLPEVSGEPRIGFRTPVSLPCRSLSLKLLQQGLGGGVVGEFGGAIELKSLGANN